MSKLTRDDNGQVATFGRLSTTQVMTVTASSVQSTAVAANCTIVRLSNINSAPAFFAIGANPTATTTTSAMLPPNATEYIEVTGGDKIAFIRGATATDVSVTQIS
jgi:GTP-dependent phosphoenolpyruvate carboxykinase